MATQGYSGSVDLISGIRPKNSGAFPLVDAHDVYVAGPDKRLDTALTEKADKSDTYTQSEIDTKIASVQTFSKRIVDTLPEAASADDKTIYLVPRTNSETPDLCDEYVVVEESGARRWERIGGTAVDLDAYATKEENAAKRDKSDLAVYDWMAPWTMAGGGIVAFEWDGERKIWVATDQLSGWFEIPEGAVLQYNATGKSWTITFNGPITDEHGTHIGPITYTAFIPSDDSIPSFAHHTRLEFRGVKTVSGMSDSVPLIINRTSVEKVASPEDALAKMSDVNAVSAASAASAAANFRLKNDLTVYIPGNWVYDAKAVFEWDGSSGLWVGKEYDESRIPPGDTSAPPEGGLSVVYNHCVRYHAATREWRYELRDAGYAPIAVVSGSLEDLRLSFSVDGDDLTFTRSSAYVVAGDELAKKSDLTDLGGIAECMKSVTHGELKALRDGGTLVPGMRYRITDYETKCNGSAPAATLSENRNVWLEAGTAAVAADVGLAALPFDVIVLATSENALSEVAYAAPREGHVYASAVNFGAWKLMYCLDNDAARFSWIDGVADAKGVVYRLVDEHGNDCGYDFKNIVYKGRSFTADSADLIHRWSFNNSLEDTGSVGGMTAVLGGNAALYNETSVRVNNGGNGTSWVELGANPIPSDLGDTPFTIEVWATPTVLQSYASVFALGERSNPTAKGLMGVFQGYRDFPVRDGTWCPVWQALGGTVGGGAEKNVGIVDSGLSVRTPYYFAYVVTPNGDGNSATIIGYVYNASTGELVGTSGVYTATNWTTSQMVQNSFNLGTTPWNNWNPGADYDEVRVWKKALTPDQIEANVAAGPDRLGSGFRYTFTSGTGDAVSDGSLVGSASGNVVGAFENGGVRYLNRVMFSGSMVAGNVLGLGCASVFVEGGSPMHNTFGPNSACVTLGAGCQYNSFGPRTRSCSFGDSTLRSRTAAGCSDLKTGRGCHFDFGDYCGDVVLGDYCQAVTLGDGCRHVRMGDYYVNVMLGNGCQDVVFGPAGGGVQSYFRGITFAPNTRKVYLYCSASRSGSDQYVRYVDVSGFSGSAWADVAVPGFLQPRRTSFVPGAGGNGVVRLEYPTQSGTLMVASS